MVKKIFLISGILLIITPFFLKGQTMDTVKCEDYFNRINDGLLITKWSRAPVLKESNATAICYLCDLLLRNSFKNTTATFIIDEFGIPICVKTNSVINNDSLKSTIMTLLYNIKFEPAIRNKEPVMSHFHLIINDKKCKTKDKEKKKRSKKDD